MIRLAGRIIGPSKLNHQTPGCRGTILSHEGNTNFAEVSLECD